MITSKLDLEENVAVDKSSQLEAENKETSSTIDDTREASLLMGNAKQMVMA